MTRITVKITYSLVMKNCRGRAQKAVEALASVTSVKARYARVSKVSAIDVTLSQENLEKVCSAMDGAAQALQGCTCGRLSEDFLRQPVNSYSHSIVAGGLPEMS